MSAEMYEYLKVIATICSVLGFFFMLYSLWKKQGELEGTIKTTMETHNIRIDQLNQRVYNLESERFLTQDEHEKISAKCQLSIYKKIDEMTVSLSNFIKAYDYYKDGETKRNLRIEKALARVETIIEERDKK